MYQSPASNCFAWSGVSVALPVIGLSTGLPFLVSQITTGPPDLAPFAPLWKCAMVAAPDSPLKVMRHDTTRVVGSQVRFAVPLPLVATGGVCSAPVSGALNLIGAAVAVPAQATQASAASAKTIRRETTRIMPPSFD